MTSRRRTAKTAVAQLSSVFLDRRATIDKACRLIEEAGGQGADLIVFPEAFVPGYPDWVWVVPNSHGAVLGELYRELLENAITIPDESTEQLCEAARAAGIRLAIGVNERNAEGSGSTLFNTLLEISERGEVLGARRKLMPTGGERTVWGQGDGSGLRAYDSPFGRVAGLLCWENLMPLARQAVYQTGAEILLAPTWDSSEAWLTAMRHIAREGGLFVVSCCQALRRDEIPDRFAFRELYPEGREWVNKGNSCIVDPRGQVLAGPLEAEQALLYAELDLDLVAAARRLFDPAGHYARPDVLRFSVAAGFRGD